MVYGILCGMVRCHMVTSVVETGVNENNIILWFR